MQLRAARNEHGRDEGGSHEQSKRQLPFALRLIVLPLIEMLVHLERRLAWNSGMMAKKEDEVNIEEGQICWPTGAGGTQC